MRRAIINASPVPWAQPVPAGTPGNSIVIISPTLLNGGFETAGAGGADVFANWAESVTGASTVTDDTVTPYSGGHACKLNVDGSNSVIYIQSASGLLVAGRTYRLTFAAKAASGAPTLKWSGVLQYGIQALTTAWVIYTATFIADATYFSLSRNVATSNSIYIDDVTLELVN